VETISQMTRRSFLKGALAVGVATTVGAGGLEAVRPRASEANAISGAWSNTLNWPLVAVHMLVLPTGKVLVWSRPSDKGELPPPPHIWHPATNALTPLEFPAGVDPYCSGHALLPTGHVLITGLGDSGDAAEIFNPFTNTWTPIPVEAAGTARYYPTHVPLGNGDQLILGGVKQNIYPPPQIWKRGGGWQHLTTS
jgi:hypothetical protein